MAIRKTTVELTETHIFCDVCGNEIKDSYGPKHCRCCDRHICFKCGTLVYDKSGGDHADIYCPDCITIRKKYKDRILELNRLIDELDDKKIELCAECKKECIKYYNDHYNTGET